MAGLFRFVELATRGDGPAVRSCQNQRTRIIDRVALDHRQQIQQLAFLIHQRGRARHHRRPGGRDGQVTGTALIAADDTVACGIPGQPSVGQELQAGCRVVDDPGTADILDPPFRTQQRALSFAIR